MLDFVVFSIFWGSSLSQIQGRMVGNKHFSAPQHSDSSAWGPCGICEHTRSYCRSELCTCRNWALQMDEFQQGQGSFFQFSKTDQSTHWEIALLKCQRDPKCPFYPSFPRESTVIIDRLSRIYMWVQEKGCNLGKKDKKALITRELLRNKVIRPLAKASQISLFDFLHDFKTEVLRGSWRCYRLLTEFQASLDITPSCLSRAHKCLILDKLNYWCKGKETFSCFGIIM